MNTLLCSACSVDIFVCHCPSALDAVGSTNLLATYSLTLQLVLGEAFTGAW